MGGLVFASRTGDVKVNKDTPLAVLTLTRDKGSKQTMNPPRLSSMHTKKRKKSKKKKKGGSYTWREMWLCTWGMYCGSTPSFTPIGHLYSHVILIPSIVVYTPSALSLHIGGMRSSLQRKDTGQGCRNNFFFHGRWLLLFILPELPLARVVHHLRLIDGACTASEKVLVEPLDPRLEGCATVH